MKPIKNRIYCLGCQHAKMLFESKSKAMNFIKFNADDIREENGTAPSRAYYCDWCGGWHVTSKVFFISDRGRVRLYLKQASDLIDQGDWASAKRFLCYASKTLSLVYEPDKDAELEKEIRKLEIKLDKKCASRGIVTSTTAPRPMNTYFDGTYNYSDLEVLSVNEICEGILYEIRPQLLAHIDDKYYYVISGKRLSPEELLITKEINELEDDALQMLTCHSLNIVQMETYHKDKKPDRQYESVADYFEGSIIAKWVSGFKLRILEQADKQTKVKYISKYCYDYWIRFGERNIHFYHGRQSKYSCIVSLRPINTSKPVWVFKNFQ